MAATATEQTRPTVRGRVGDAADGHAGRDVGPGPAAGGGHRPLRRAPAWLRGAAARRHGVWAEIAGLVLVYLAYDAARGLVGGDRATPFANARFVARLERHLHLFVEPHVQAAAERVPGLVGLFGFGYATFHLGVTGAVLIWVYHRRPEAFGRVRTTLVLTTLLALVGFTVFPSAPPRLAGVGVADVLHLGRATAGSGLLRVLYNPYAAVPSLHMAYALIAGGSVTLLSRRRLARVVGAAYPLFVAVEVVATGNHFLFDLVAGAATVALAVVATAPLGAVPVVDRSSRRPGRRQRGGGTAPGPRPLAAATPAPRGGWRGVD